MTEGFSKGMIDISVSPSKREHGSSEEEQDRESSKRVRTSSGSDDSFFQFYDDIDVSDDQAVQSPVVYSDGCLNKTPPVTKIVGFPTTPPWRSERLNKCQKGMFDILSDEIILMIFKKLDKPTLVNCARTCRRWKDISYDPNLWSRIDISHKKICSNGMYHVLTRYPNVLRMAQTEVTSPMFTTISTNIKKNRLEYLDLSMAVMEPSDLHQLLSQCENLIKLSLESCTLDGAVCHDVAENVNLTVLNMSSSTGITTGGIHEIVVKCRKLEELNLAWTGLQTHAIRTVTSLLTKNIKKLNLSGCLKNMSDKYVATLVEKCQHLTELDLSDCTSITEASISCITTYSNNLEQLSLSRCYSIKPTGYLSLLKMPSLRYLNIFGMFEDRNIEALQQNCKKVAINNYRYSSIARPTVSPRCSSMWGISFRNHK